MCPEKINSLKIISLSARIVVQRADDIRSNINSKFKDKTNYFKWFSWLWMSQQMLTILVSFFVVCLFEEAMPN